jgi:uncharacterized protein YndB with AHSA1/START domain
MHYVERTIEINAPVERVFDSFSDFESYPRWMKNVAEVRFTSRSHTHWVAETPDGEGVEWEAETTAFEPDHRIAWQSVAGDIRTVGEVVLEETSEATTLLKMVIGYDRDDFERDTRLALALGKNPARQLEDNLDRLTDNLERRGTKRNSRDELAARERPPRRRYEQKNSVQADRGPRPEPQHEWHYAMTPWERERERHRDDPPMPIEDSSRFLRRGVDKLMDNAPSGRWNDSDEKYRRR